MSTKIKYRLAARTEAAGKYDPSAPQEGNEDNYGLISNIAKPDFRLGFDEVSDLGEMGLLLFVADGMGGHSAGEVASKIAVDTVYEAFSDGKIDAETASSHHNRSRYLEDTIHEADKRIRKYSKQHNECEGMGSTLIIAWLMGDELTVSWCGDSRAYLYHSTPKPCIEMVSEDHSYVQELVQRNVIPYEATFGHPRGNIVTRCLGGGGGSNTQPESRLAHVAKGDIILLCSDGLSGVLFDDGRLFDGQPITEENICDTITANRHQLRECAGALFAAAERQNWYDNVTTILCEVVDGRERKQSDATTETDSTISAANNTMPKNRNRIVLFAIGFLLVVIGGVVGAMLMRIWNNNNLLETVAKDSIPQQTGDQNQYASFVKILEFTADKLVISGNGDYYIVRIDKHDTVIKDTVYRFSQRLTEGTHTASVRSVCGQDTAVSVQKNINILPLPKKVKKTRDIPSPKPDDLIKE